MTHNFNITPNFTYLEVIHTTTPYHNEPVEPETFCNLFRSVVLLQDLRDELFKCPITINSGFRSAVVNKAVGGVSTSDHLKGFAFDIVVKGIEPYKVFSMLHDYSKRHPSIFGQVIEYANFVHVSFNRAKHKNEFIPKLF